MFDTVEAIGPIESRHVLAICTILAFISIVLWSYTKEALSKLPVVSAAVTSLIAAYFLIWFILATCEPKTAEYTSLHEIKAMTFPDGRTKSIFVVDGIIYVAEQQFKMTIIPGSSVKRTVYNHTYRGIDMGNINSLKDNLEIIQP